MRTIEQPTTGKSETEQLIAAVLGSHKKVKRLPGEAFALSVIIKPASRISKVLLGNPSQINKIIIKKNKTKKTMARPDDVTAELIIMTKWSDLGLITYM